MASKNIEKLTKEKADELLSLMGTDAETKVESSDTGFNLEISADKEKGLLIGSRGETLHSFQTILNLILKEETGEWQNVQVNIGDWREKQEAYLKDLADQASRRVKETGRPQHLYNLNSSQRRTIHTFLAEDDDLETFSEGEGKERYLVIQAKGNASKE